MVKSLPANHIGVEVSQCAHISRVSGTSQFHLLQVWAAHIPIQRSAVAQLQMRKDDGYKTDASGGSSTSCRHYVSVSVLPSWRHPPSSPRFYQAACGEEGSERLQNSVLTLTARSQDA